MCDSIVSNFKTEALFGASKEIRKNISLETFGKLLDGVPKDWIPVYSIFSEVPPLKYWNPDLVIEALEILNVDKDRTLEALDYFNGDLDIAFSNLTKSVESLPTEERIELNKTKDLLLITKVFHPEYLRILEHIYSNIIPLFWAVQRKGSIKAQCVPKNAVSELRNKNLARFTTGFNDRIRNGISHGQISFRGDGIQYGDDKGKILVSASDFLSEYDELWRTTNSLALSVLLFIGKHNQEIKEKKRKIPLSIICAVVSSLFDSEGIKINGIVESDFKLAGPQLHISIKLYQASKSSHFYHTTNISLKLLELGLSRYGFYLFDIDCGNSVSSTVSIVPKTLLNLMSMSGSMGRIGEIYDMNRCLLWSDESSLVDRIKIYKLILKERFKFFKENMRREFTKIGWGLSYSYIVKDRKVIKSDNIRRVEIRAVLKHPVDSLDIKKITQVVLHIVNQNKNKLVRAPKSMFSKKIVQIPSVPSYISVNLYRLDGPIRWIGAGGWQDGNLIAVAEYVRLEKLKPLVVEKPEVVIGRVRIRYSGDQEAIQKVQEDILNLVEKIHADAVKNKS